MFAYKPTPKPEYKRRTPKRAIRGRFTATTRKRIIERDDGLCVRCRAKYEEIHHIVFRSAGGKGTVDNGCCVCRECHTLAHSKQEVRKWFEDWNNAR